MAKQPTTQTRSQRLTHLLSIPVPLCSSPEYKHEYYKILWMLRSLLDSKSAHEVWITTLLEEALCLLQSLTDPKSTPTDSRKEDNRLWTEISVRRIIAETMWEGNGTVSFHDCYDALRQGRSRAAQARVCDQIRRCWESITALGAGTELEFRF